VGTCGIYVEGNAEIAATADFISIHLLILGADSNHDVYIFAGAIGLGAPAHLGVDESPIVIAHCRNGQHYTRTRILHRQWCAPKKAKRARIEELRRQNENEANLMESARAAVIMRARYIAEQARISLSQKVETNLPDVMFDIATSIAPKVAPANAALPSVATSAPMVVSLINALPSPAPSAPMVTPSTAALPSPIPTAIIVAPFSALSPHPRRQLLRLSLRSHLILGASCCAFLCALTSSSVLVVAPFSALSPAPSGYYVEPTINPISPEPACAVCFRSLNTIDYGVSCRAVGFNASSGDKYLICCCGGDDCGQLKRNSSLK